MPKMRNWYWLLITAFVALIFSVGTYGIISILPQEPAPDKIQGRPIITKLDVDTLSRGDVHEFYFQTITNNIGQHWYVPVTVIRGDEPGKKVLIVAGVHGDEANGMGVTIHLKRSIEPSELSGTVTIVHSANITGLLNNSRGYKHPGNTGGSMVDLNTLFGKGKIIYHEGEEQLYAGDVPELAYANLMWYNLLAPNADYTIDLHTAGTGAHGPLVVHADFRNPEVATMAKLLGADVILMEENKAGSIEKASVQAGIPAVSLDLGASERYQADVVKRTADGILNYLTYLKMLEGHVKDYPEPFIANSSEKLFAAFGGYSFPKVAANAYVTKGDVIAAQYDGFGKRTDYLAPISGKVLELRHYPTNEPGTVLLKIVYYDPEHPTQILATP